MKLLDNIVEAITETKEPISDTLRRCLVLSFKLKNDTLKTWAEHELNGYDSDDVLPDYRTARGVAKGLFLGAFGQELRDQPLPASVLKPEHRHFATDIKLSQPIAAYENIDKSKNPVILWPQDLVSMYQAKFYDGMALNRAWMEIPISTMIGLVDTVRTRILTLLLQIKDELPASEEQAVEQIPPAVVQRIVNVSIYGGHNVLGDVQELNAPTVVAGDRESLKAAMSALGVTESEFTELENTLRTGGDSNATGRSLSAKTLEWIGKTAKKLGESGLKIGGSVAEEAIKLAVLDYLKFS